MRPALEVEGGERMRPALEVEGGRGKIRPCPSPLF